MESSAFGGTFERKPSLEACRADPRGIPIPPLKLSLQVLLLRRVIHVLYVECSLNPLLVDELQLAEKEM